MGTKIRRAHSKPHPTSEIEPVRTGGRWHPFAIAASVLLVYANGLGGPFVLDDQASIVDNPSIREWWRLRDVLNPEPNSPVAGRPIVNLSFALNYAIGGLDVLGYHLWNVGVHVACALIFYGIMRRTLERLHPRGPVAGRAGSLGLAAALVWAVHPLNSEVVNYLTQRTESMMAASLLMTLYASIRAYRASGPRWNVVAVVSCALGMACKETMVVAPVLVALYDRTYLYASWREAIRNRRFLYAALAATWVVLAGLVLGGPRSAVGGFASGVPVWTYLLNQTVMITEYLRLAVWPAELVVFYGWPLPLTLGQVAGHAVFVVALLAATIVALVRAPKAGFLWGWFFITLAPTTSVIAIATEVGAERRMYLPLAAVSVLGVLGVFLLLERVRLPRAAPSLLVLASIALAAATMVRNREYASTVTLAQTVVDRRPSGVAHHILGEQLLLASRTGEGVNHLRQAVALGNSRARYVLGHAYLVEGKGPEALEQFDAFVRTAGVRQVPRWLEPAITEVVIARALMSEILASQGRWPEAAVQARIVLETVPTHMVARRVLATALFNQRLWPEAVDGYREYLRRNPRDADAFVNLGVSLVAVGRLDEAVEAFRSAVGADPVNANARRLLDMALRDQASTARP